MINFPFNFVFGRRLFKEKEREIHQMKLKRIDSMRELTYINKFDNDKYLCDSFYITYCFLEILFSTSNFNNKKQMYVEKELIYKRGKLIKLIALFGPPLLRFILINQLYYVYFNYFVKIQTIN